jgi:hypothetical protein
VTPNSNDKRARGGGKRSFYWGVLDPPIHQASINTPAKQQKNFSLPNFLFTGEKARLRIQSSYLAAPIPIMESMPPLAALALAITAQDWTSLGLGDDPLVAATDDVALNVERLTSLFLVRIVAIVSPEGKFQDLSTTSICRKSLLQSEPWPEPINDTVIDQLREYVRSILETYNDTPYHCKAHAVHVTISINKLLDLILNTDIQGQRLHPTFGLRADAMMHLVLVFSALIHDAEHR